MKEQLSIGLLAVAVGLSGWLLPYRWNLLRLRRGLRGRVSEATNRRIPKVVGSLLIIVGGLLSYVSLVSMNGQTDASIPPSESSSIPPSESPSTSPSTSPFESPSASPSGSPPISTALTAPAQVEPPALENPSEADVSSTDLVESDAPNEDVEAFMNAITRGATEKVRDFLARGFDPNTVDSEGDQPLHLAADFGQVKIFQILVEAGADINAPSESDMTPLYTAVNANNTRAVRELLALGADPNAHASYDGSTPLGLALFNGDRQIAKALIEAGADLNAEDFNSVDVTGQTDTEVILDKLLAAQN